MEEYAEKYGTVYVTTGPIFDYNSDGLADDISDIKMYIPQLSAIFESVSYSPDLDESAKNLHLACLINCII